MAQVITRGPGRTFCYCNTQLLAPGWWQVIFSIHVKDPLIKKIVRERSFQVPPTLLVSKISRDTNLSQGVGLASHSTDLPAATN